MPLWSRFAIVHKYFTRGSERIDVLQGVNLDIPQGDFLALMGPSGSGKTTLLNLIGGLDTPTERLDRRRRRPHRQAVAAASCRAWRARHIGFVFQLYNLLPVLTAERNVELPLLLTKLSKARAAQARRRSRSKVVGLADRAQALPAPAVGRPGAARRHRPRDRHRPDAAAVRRADRRSRSQGRRRNPRPAAGAQPRARQDDRDGDARPARGRARQADAAPREGRARRRRRSHEVPAARLAQPAAAEGPHDLHAAVDLRRLPAVRLADGDPHAFSMGVDMAGARPADGDPQGQSIIAAAGRATRRSIAGDARRRRRSRTPTGSAASTRTRRTSSRTFAVEPETLLKMYPEFELPDRADEGLARRSHRARSSARHRRSGSAGRSATACRSRARSTGSPTAATWEFNIDGIYDARQGRRQDAVLLPLRLPRRDDRSAAASGTGRLVHRQDRRPDAVAGDRRDVRRDVRELVGRDQDRHREGLRRRLRQAGRRHRRDHDARSSRRCSSRSCWSPANTMAQAVRERTSELAVLKTLGFPTAAISRWCCRVAAHRARRRRARPGAGLAARHSGGDPTGGLLPAFYPADARRSCSASC